MFLIIAVIIIIFGSPEPQLLLLMLRRQGEARRETDVAPVAYLKWAAGGRGSPKHVAQNCLMFKKFATLLINKRIYMSVCFYVLYARPQISADLDHEGGLQRDCRREQLQRDRATPRSTMAD